MNTITIGEMENKKEEEGMQEQESQVLEMEVSTDENGEVYYHLTVPEGQEGQVIDLSNIFAQEGIQVIESNELAGVGEELDLLQSNQVTEVTDLEVLSSDQSDARQSAKTLIDLSNSHIVDLKEDDTQEVIIPADQLTDSNTATYVLDEDGTMIPLNEYKEKHGDFLEIVEEESIQTEASLSCWCGKVLSSVEQLDKHKAYHARKRRGNGTELNCELCDMVFPTSTKLASHHRMDHPNKMPWECSVCFRRFSKKLGLKVHLRAHAELMKHKCPHCDRSFSYKNALLRHVRLHTKDKPYKCTVCGELFALGFAMRRHRATHMPKQVFECEVCSKTFKQKTTLFIHSRIHTGHKPYTCDICRKSFTLKSSLNQHLRIHTGERPKVCPICEKTFRQTSTMKSHMKLHSHLKPYKCRYCKKRFKTLEEMEGHEEIHLDNKAWFCEQCGMRFRNQSLLARHGRKHTNERPFQCKICGKSFGQSGSLQSHMRTHTKEKPYQCRLCSKAYTTSGTLLLHIRRAHNLEAKSVKDVFPSSHRVEDQKIFTIPTPGSRNSSSVGELTNALNRQTVMFEQVVAGTNEDSDLVELATHDKKVLIERLNASDSHLSGDNNDETEAVVLETEEEIVNTSLVKKEVVSDTEDGEKEGTKQELVRAKSGRSGSLTFMNVDSSGQYTIVDSEKENSLYAQARQEAALGLAELSLVGGVVVSEKKSGRAYRTVARGSEADGPEDPSVTKIILSKEGGIMNSQDPHQCPECKRIFGRKSIMVEHRRIHTDEKPYKCDFCTGEYRQSAQLTCHIRNKHTEVKRYLCTFCDKKFLSKSITVRHINFHHKLKLRVFESSCQGWTVEDAITFMDGEQEPDIKPKKTSKVTSKFGGRATIKCGQKSNITILDTSTGLVSISPSVKVKLTKEKRKYTKVEECLPSIKLDRKNSCDDSKSGDGGDGLEVTGDKGEQRQGIDASVLEQLAVDDEPGTWYVCESCSMQFDAMDGLREHLLTVHNTTLGESSVSYVYDDEDTDPNQSTSEWPDEADDPVVDTTQPQQEEETAVKVLGNHINITNQPIKLEINDAGELMTVGGNHETNAIVSKIVKDKIRIGGRIEIPPGNKNKTIHHNSNFGTSNSHGKHSLQCPMCLLNCNNRNELEVHLMIHPTQEVELAGLHRCDKCGTVVKNSQQMSKHILKVHGVENIYSCSICDKEFFQESLVVRHMKFFHKWEMKIRGEVNIPILLKPASEHLKEPGASDRDKIKGKVNIQTSPYKRHQKSDLKVSSRYENDMTFISLEVGDLDHLQLYREDGQEVKFEVVSSTDRSTVIRIKDPANGAVGGVLDKVLEGLEDQSVIVENVDPSSADFTGVSTQGVHTNDSDSLATAIHQDPKVSVFDASSPTGAREDNDNVEIMVKEMSHEALLQEDNELVKLIPYKLSGFPGQTVRILEEARSVETVTVTSGIDKVATEHVDSVNESGENVVECEEKEMESYENEMAGYGVDGAGQSEQSEQSDQPKVIVQQELRELPLSVSERGKEEHTDITFQVDEQRDTQDQLTPTLKKTIVVKKAAVHASSSSIGVEKAVSTEAEPDMIIANGSDKVMNKMIVNKVIVNEHQPMVTSSQKAGGNGDAVCVRSCVFDLSSKESGVANESGCIELGGVEVNPALQPVTPEKDGDSIELEEYTIKSDDIDRNSANSKLRTISVLKNSPKKLDSKKTSNCDNKRATRASIFSYCMDDGAVNQEQAKQEKVPTSSIPSPQKQMNCDDSSPKNELALSEDKDQSRQLKRGRQANTVKQQLVDTPVKQGGRHSANQTGIQTNPANCHTKPVSLSSSGRVIKRKRFADE